MEGVINNKLKQFTKKYFRNPPVQGVRNFCMAPYGPIENPKNENSDNVSIMVKMCSSGPQTNPYDI